MQREATINGIAALLVLLTAMIEPWLSVGIAIAVLAGLAVYQFRKGRSRP